jgi:uncharacterized repeat protein (TIGR01451 family)
MPAMAVDVQVSSLTDTPDPATRGGIINYQIRVENQAADTANNVTLSFPLPATTTFVAVDNGSCTHDGGTPGTVNCSFGNLLGTAANPPGLVIETNVEIRTTAATGNTIDVTATASTTSSDTNGANNSLNQNTTIDDGADLLPVWASATPDPVIGGGNVTFVAEVSNNGPNDSVDPQVVFQLSTNVTFLSVTDNDWTCAHNNVDPGGQITCTRASLANGATSPTITFVTQVTGAATGTLTTTATTSADTDDPDPNNDVASIDVQVNAGTDIAVTVANPGAVIELTAFDLVVRPRNNGPIDAANPSVAINIPAGFTINGDGTSPFSSNGWNCTIAGQVVTCIRGSMTVGSTNDILVPLTAPGVATQTSYTNPPGATITSDADEAPDRLANNSDTATITVNPNGADIEVLKSKGPNPVAQGSAITSTIRVRNNGPVNAGSGSIVVTDTLDVGNEDYVSASGTNWSCSFSSPDVICTYNAALNNGNLSSTLTITTTATNAGSLTNTACAAYSGTPGDYDNTNDCQGATVTSTAAIADLQVTKAANADNSDADIGTLAANESTVTYTISVLNNGPSAVDGIVIEDDLPVYVSWNGGTGVTANITSAPGGVTFNCSVASDGDVTCTQTAGSVASGESVELTIEASRPLRDGSRTNTASAFSNTVGDDDRTNNTDTSTVQIDPVADIQVQSKTVTPNPVRAGVNSTYTITVRNNGPSAAQDVVVTDVFTLPGGDTGFTFISANPSQGSCMGLTAGTSYVSTDTPTLTCSLGSMGRNNTQTIQVTIRPNWISGDSTRQFTNTATATTTTWESDDTDNDGNGEDETNSNNINSATLDIQASEIDLLINNTDIPDPLGWDPAGVPPGDDPLNDVVYEVESQNRGPSLATGTQFVYTMTPKSGKTVRFECDEVASSDACGTSADQCSISNGSNPVTGPATLELTCDIGNDVGGVWQMPANSTFGRFLRFRFLSEPDTTGDTHATNATIDGNEVEPILGNNAEAENTSVRAKVDLVVAKSATPANVQLHQPFNWVVTVTNDGPLASEETSLTDSLPMGMRFHGAAPSWSNPDDSSSSTCTATIQDMSCDLGLVSAGSVVTITIPVLIESYTSETVQNCASATTLGVDPNADNSTNVCGSVSVSNSFFPADYGDAPDAGAGTGPGNFQTTFADGGPRHLEPGVSTWLGACVDADGPGTQQNVAADADDTNAGTGTSGTCVGNDDEDGVVLPPAFVAEQQVELDITVGGPAESTCRLDGWVDYNADGDFLDAGEQIFNAQVLALGSHTLPVNVPAGITPGVSYARFRCSDSGGLSPTEEVTGGEVEDYRVSLQPNPDAAPTPTDYGDAPDGAAGTTIGDYNTRGVDDGASHVLGVADSPYLGACVDSDTGIQQNVTALADDNTAAGGSGAVVTTGTCATPGDDEDGVTFADTIVLGLSTDITVSASAGTNDCRLDAWIDFNADGDFLDAGEQIATDQAITSGSSAWLAPNVPLSGVAGETYARFRCSSAGGLAPTGAAADGEVEDYRIELQAATAALTLLKEADTEGPVDFGDTINYTLTATNANTSNVILDQVLINDPLAAPLTCTPAAPATLAPGEALVCTGSYEVMPADVEAQQPIVNTATATGEDPFDNPVESPEATTSTPMQPPNIVQVEVEAICVQDAPLVNWTVVGEGVVNPTLTIRWIANDGSGVVEELTNQPLSGQLLWPDAEVDGQGNGIAWPGWEQDAQGNWFEVPTNLRPTVDIEFQLNPTERRTLVYPPATEACRTEPPLPAIALVKESNTEGPVAIDDQIVYTLTATNTGNVALTAVEIQDDMIELQCDPMMPADLGIGEQLICTGTYTVQASDIGQPLLNEATVVGISGEDLVTRVTDNADVTVSTQPPIPVPVNNRFSLLWLALGLLLIAAFRFGRFSVSVKGAR